MLRKTVTVEQLWANLVHTASCLASLPNPIAVYWSLVHQDTLDTAWEDTLALEAELKELWKKDTYANMLWPYQPEVNNGNNT